MIGWILFFCLAVTGCVSCVKWYDTMHTWVVVDKCIRINGMEYNSIYTVYFAKQGEDWISGHKVVPKEYYDNYKIGDTIMATNGYMD